MKRLSLVLVALMLPLTALAATMLEAGDHVPENFIMKNAQGRPVNLADISEEKGVLLMFVRSVDWCPYCKNQVKEWSAKIDEVNAAGYAIAAASNDSTQTLAQFATDNDIALTLLSDVNSSMIKAFGILNDEFKPGSPLHGIPNPAIYVINAEGKITHVFREEGYQDRPDPAQVMKALN